MTLFIFNELFQLNKLMAAILPLSYLPPIDQYCYLVQEPNVLFEIHETYPKQTIRNRANILTANGVLALTVPVKKPFGNRSKTADIMIDYSTPWNKIHWRAITSAYNKSPFFLYFRDDLEKIFMHKHELLIDFNTQLIIQINKFLQIYAQPEFTSTYIKEYSAFVDKRNCDKDKNHADHELKIYTQVFSDRFPFIPNLSIIDLLFNVGPTALLYLKNSLIQ